MSKVNELIPEFCKYIPKDKEHGVLYISEEYRTSIHLCACGCGEETVMPFNSPDEWVLVNNNGLITMRPSVGNFKWETPYHAHYYITDNKIQWL